MKVAIETTPAISQGLRSPAAERLCGPENCRCSLTAF